MNRNQIIVGIFKDGKRVYLIDTDPANGNLWTDDLDAATIYPDLYTSAQRLVYPRQNPI